MDAFKLREGNNLPAVGFGTWQLTGDECYRSVLTALECGYRHIDTADKYANHDVVGKAITDSKLNRSEIFLTTKVWRGELSQDHLIYACERFLDELKTDYIDLLLIHWPNSDTPICESLAGLSILKSKGLIKSCGFANFEFFHLDNAKECEVDFSVNQFEIHPSFAQKKLLDYCSKNNIQPVAYSPNGQGQDLKLTKIIEIAQKYEKTPSQIILNWLINRGVAVIPRSGNPEHIKENFDVTGWKLDDLDYSEIDKLDTGNRILSPSYAEFT